MRGLSAPAHVTARTVRDGRGPGEREDLQERNREAQASSQFATSGQVTNDTKQMRSTRRSPANPQPELGSTHRPSLFSCHEQRRGNPDRAVLEETSRRARFLLPGFSTRMRHRGGTKEIE